MLSHAQQFGAVNIVVAGTQTFDDGFRENDWLHRYGGFLKMETALSPFQSLTVSSMLMYHKRGDFIWWKDARNALRPDVNQRDYRVTALRVNTMADFKSYVNEVFSYELKGVHFRGHWSEDSLDIKRSTESLSDVFNLEFQGNYALGRPWPSSPQVAAPTRSS